MLWARILGFVIFLLFAFHMIFAIKHIYLYAKEQGYEQDFTPLFLFPFNVNKYLCQVLKISEKDSYHKKMARKYYLYALLSFTAMWIVNCIFQLLGYV